jgi:hypothetical protein
VHPSVEMPHFPVHMADTGGHSVTALSIVRLYYMYRNFFVVEEDPTYSLAYIISAVESNCAIVAATIPALWPLARRWFPSMDDKLGINRPHQADIEVQLFGDVDPTTAGVSPPKVKVTWTRADTVRRGRNHLESPNLGQREAARQLLREQRGGSELWRPYVALFCLRLSPAVFHFRLSLTVSSGEARRRRRRTITLATLAVPSAAGQTATRTTA